MTRAERDGHAVLQSLRNRVPAPARKRVTAPVRFGMDVTLDLVDMALGRREDLVPPRRLRRHFDRSVQEYKGIGEEFLGYFLDLCGLQPHETVLEIGSGLGRMAVPLGRYLTSGQYHGLDIMPTAVRWCQQNISRRYPNFHFYLADLHNETYNPRGRIAGDRFVFPFEADTMDFVFLTSVFTHMTTAEVARYLSEILRVMKRGGRCLVTCFLLNDASLRGISEGQSAWKFSVERGDHFIESEENPALAVAFPEQIFHELVTESGLRVIPPLHYGFWSGGAAGLTFQDVVRLEPA